MSAASLWFVKEWRAQRAFALGYLGLVFAAITSIVLIAQGRGVVLGRPDRAAGLVLGYAGAGFAGALVLAGLAVQSEFVGGRDHLWRRLPGALLPAAIGKVAFLFAASIAMAFAGVLIGEVVVLSLGAECVTPAMLGALVDLSPIPWPGAAAAVVLVFAVTAWMPQGRLGAGAALVLACALALAVDGVLRLCPGLGTVLARDRVAGLVPSWLIAAGTAVAIAGIAWGRRGGDHRRTARIGAATLIVALSPGVVWLGDQVVVYHWPSPSDLVAEVHRIGSTPDGRYVLVAGAHSHEFRSVPFRVDLATGEAVQIGAAGTWLRALTPTGLFAGDLSQRWWWASSGDGRRNEILDATTLERRATGFDADHLRFDLPADLRDGIGSELRRTTPLRQPGDLPAWFEGAELCLAQRSGEVRRVRLPVTGFSGVIPAGHGFVAMRHREPPFAFDFARGEAVVLPRCLPFRAFAVNGTWLLAPENDAKVGPKAWRRFDPATTTTTECDELARTDSILALLDDDTLLVCGEGARSLFTHRPADRTRSAVELPEHPFLQREWYASDCDRTSPYGRRDRRGRVWVRLSARRTTAVVFVAIDPATRRAEVVVENPLLFDPVVVEDAAVVGVEDYHRLVRIDLRTKEHTVLFPRR